MHAPIERRTEAAHRAVDYDTWCYLRSHDIWLTWAFGIWPLPHRVAVTFRLPDPAKADRRSARTEAHRIEAQHDPDARKLALQRIARRYRDHWRDVCRALGIPDPDPETSPVGLRGLYYPDYNNLEAPKPRFPKRFEVGAWGDKTYLWRTANGVRVRSVLPAPPKNAPPQKGKTANRPIMHRWVIERHMLWRPPRERNFWFKDGKRIWTPEPWLMRDPSWCEPHTACEAYSVAIERLGFRLKGGRPESTYVPYRRPRSGRIAPLVADPNADLSDDAYLGLVEEANPKPEQPLPAAEQLDDAELKRATEEERDELDEYLLVLNEVEQEIVASLARDMGTRFQWQRDPAPPARKVSLRVRRNAEKNRRKAWEEFFASPHVFRSFKPTFKRGRPKLEDVRVWDFEDKLSLYIRGRQLKSVGYRYVERMARLSAEWKISPATTKRIHDGVARKVKRAAERLLNRK